ncbi:MAG: GDSL-type esterase/lipase family protein [Candidatus Electrothrix sp. YB6]
MYGQTKKSLLMIGDSLVEWGDWETLLPDMQVINCGIAGEHTEELSARLACELEAVQEPDYILLMSGTNNLLMGSLYFSSIFAGMLPRLVNLCPDSTVTVNSIMPMRGSGLPEVSIAAANRKLRKVTEQNSCSFLDMTEPFTEQCLPVTKPCFLNDGVHLSTRGYQVWAGEIGRFFGEIKKK